MEIIVRLCRLHVYLSFFIPVATSEHRTSVKRLVSIQFLNLRQSVGLLGRGSARRKVAAYTEKHKQNKCRETSMPRVGLQPTILVYERAKTFQAWDRAATVIGTSTSCVVTKFDFFILILLRKLRRDRTHCCNGRVVSSGKCCRVVWQRFTDVSENDIAFIFKAEVQAKQATSNEQAKFSSKMIILFLDIDVQTSSWFW
jgi:hypothetical protein